MEMTSGFQSSKRELSIVVEGMESDNKVLLSDLRKGAELTPTGNHVIIRRNAHRSLVSPRSSNEHERIQQEEDAPSRHDINAKKLDAEITPGRYFQVLEGHDLEYVKDPKAILLPLDVQWPFLLRFPINCFGVCLATSHQAILWKNLASIRSLNLHNIFTSINLTFWCLAISLLVLIFVTYVMKCIFHFEAIRREYQHPIRVNFFFTPSITAMYLAIGSPHFLSKYVNSAIWYPLVIPLVLLELKVYGTWLCGGERRLSKVSNPSVHLAVVGNFVAACLGAVLGWKEQAIFMWIVGLVHYLVVFVTLYQRLPTTETIAKELHPIYFLYFACPTIASVAWEKISGDFDVISKCNYFIGLFLFASLLVRPKTFVGFKFSLAWWGYSVPLNSLAINAIHYYLKFPNKASKGLAIVLSTTSVIVYLMLTFRTASHVIKGTLFPNDLAIAIAPQKKSKKRKNKKLMKKPLLTPIDIRQSDDICVQARHYVCVGPPCPTLSSLHKLDAGRTPTIHWRHEHHGKGHHISPLLGHYRVYYLTYYIRPCRLRV